MRDTDSEVVFNTLIADGLDVSTAYAASIDDLPAGRSDHARQNRRYFDAGLLIGLALWLAYQLL
jgi:hypothetical protein